MFVSTASSLESAKKVGVPSDEIRFGNHRDCPHAVLDTSHFLYPKYQELYPEECKMSAKK